MKISAIEEFLKDESFQIFEEPVEPLLQKVPLSEVMTELLGSAL
jgi:hypothetical protein